MRSILLYLVIFIAAIIIGGALIPGCGSSSDSGGNTGHDTQLGTFELISSSDTRNNTCDKWSVTYGCDSWYITHPSALSNYVCYGRNCR
jgi:hypothetical protein